MASILVWAVATVLVQAAAPESLSIRFVGNAALEISDGRTTLITDFPYQSGAFGYMTYDGTSIAPPGDVVALITHRHLDHFDPDRFRARGWRIVGPKEVTRSLPAERVIGLDSVIQMGPLRIQALPTPHRNVEHYSYLITWHGTRIYLSGDTEDPSRLLATTDLDLAVITSWLWNGIRTQGQSLSARRVAIYHHHAGERVAGCPACWIPAQGDRIGVPTRVRRTTTGR